MTPDAPDEGALSRKAAELLTRRDAGWTPEAAAEFALWRAANPAHDAAVRRIEAAQQLLGRLPETPAAAAMFAEVEALYRHRRVVRMRRWRIGAVALAAAAAVVLAVWWVQPKPAPGTTVIAAVDRARTVDLNDGSTMGMDSGSSVDVQYLATERRITLRQGVVRFSVAKDAKRPFIVAAGRMAVRAVGTAFKVAYGPEAIDVAVTEGKVQVTWNAGDAAGQPLYLAAGEGARFGLDGAGPSQTARAETNSGAAPIAWHAPRLEFSNTPLSDVVNRFNQYSRVQLELGDPELATRPVGGTFDADRSELFVSLLAAAGDIKVERVSETHLILRKAR